MLRARRLRRSRKNAILGPGLGHCSDIHLGVKMIKEPLSLRRILLYSSASAGLNIVSITVGTWILYFYAPPPDSGRVQYLPVTLVGVLLTVTTLWDAIIDP